MDKQYIVVNVSEGIRLASIVQDDDGNNVIFETKEKHLNLLTIILMMVWWLNIRNIFVDNIPD